MEEKTLEERIYIYYKKLNNKLNFYNKLAIENIEKNIKNDRIESKRTEYIDLLDTYNDLFKDELKSQKMLDSVEKTINSINDTELPWDNSNIE